MKYNIFDRIIAVILAIMLTGAIALNIYVIWYVYNTYIPCL